MTANCRICQSSGSGNSDPLVSCNNCGSLVCNLHHTWWGRSKNAFCTECFPIAASGTLTESAAALASIETNEITNEHLSGFINSILEEHRLSLDQLIKLLEILSDEIQRRMNYNRQ